MALTLTNTVPAFALVAGQEFFDLAGDRWVAESVETDVAKTGGYVAVYVGGERLLFTPQERIDVPVGEEGLVR